VTNFFHFIFFVLFIYLVISLWESKSTCHFLIGLCFPLAQVSATGVFRSLPCSRET